jgi:hypothetical protein
MKASLLFALQVFLGLNLVLGTFFFWFHAPAIFGLRCIG